MNIPHKSHLIIGMHCLHEVMKYCPQRVIRVYTTSAKCAVVEPLCISHKVPCQVVSDKFLTKISETDSHQSVVIHMKDRLYTSLHELLERSESTEQSLVVMVDQIYDPQNFGAILRSCECFGVDAVVFSKNRGTEITPIVAKASCGASEILPLVRISNLADTMHKFQERGYEAVVSLLDASSENAFSFTFSPKTLLVVGSEDQGIQPLLQKKADRSIFIPLQGKIQSLNVSAATSALLTCFFKSLI